MKLSEVNATLREIRVSPVKTLGQNFLHDQNLARWIVEEAKIGPEDFVVEIGPGLGALTELIVAKGSRVLAIEKDARLVDFLRRRFPTSHVQILHEDALNFDLRGLHVHPRVKVLGNLPYYISTQLLMKYLAAPSPISLWLFTLQKELVARLSAGPRCPDYGALTLIVQLEHRVEFLRTLSATVFLPQPDVDSAVARFTQRLPEELPWCDRDVFRKLVRVGFSQRRKQLQKLLREEVPDWTETAKTLGVKNQVRAEELSLEHWIALTNLVASPPVPDRTKVDRELFAVVDESDQVIRTATRAEVHANNLRHRAVHILIFNPFGEVFLQRRSRWKDRHPLRWDSSAAGHVEAAEEYDETARRELQEELGITVPLHRVAKLAASERTDQEFVSLYRGGYDGDLHIAAGEIDTGEFFPPEIVTGWISARPSDFATAFVECWRAYLSEGKGELP